jgi:hypothetical protein
MHSGMKHTTSVHPKALDITLAALKRAWKEGA